MSNRKVISEDFAAQHALEMEKLRIAIEAQAVERKVVKKEKPVAKASSNTASKPTTSSSQGAPSAKDAAPEKTKKSSGKPPLTPKKRKFPTESATLVEEDEEETSPTPLEKKQKKNKATVASYQTTNQQGVEIKIFPPPSKETQSQPSGGAVLEHIGSNASDPEAQQEKPTTPLISTANQSDPSSDMNPSPPSTISSVVQNKGSSTGAQNLEADNVQNEQETSSPSEDDYADEDDQDSDEIEGYFLQDEDMSEGEADPEGNQTGTDDATVETVPDPTNVRSSTIQTSPISLTEEEKNSLKQNDPLKEVHVKAKLQSTEQAQATEFDNALRTSKASEELAASRKSAQAEFDTYNASIQLWESHIAELQKKMSDAKAKQAAIQGLDSTEADNLAK
ncbi:uncharacterized protein LOC127102048 [Lathyrus oleraceus]|uniref:uncharacterized protein LOC127102048 n=1 Tax=Pisum sativum TaxID=3888 RepID=UPI0021D3EAB9|nr:uncharacterized protein LOC127102048 [Pisum sativum]